MITNKNNPDIKGFDPKIREIEREIAEFFAAKSSEYIGRNPIISKIMTYFSIRKKLTQKELQQLTGFSAGTISKAVHQLLEMNVITKGTIPGTHKHVYKMEKLPFVSPQYFLRTESAMEKKILELVEIKKTLEAHKDEMENFESYQKIYKTVTQLLQILPSISGFMDKLEEQLNKNKE